MPRKTELKALEPEVARPLWQNAVVFGSMLAILVFANWGAPATGTGFWQAVYAAKWYLTAAAAIVLGGVLVAWFRVAWPDPSAAAPRGARGRLAAGASRACGGHP